MPRSSKRASSQSKKRISSKSRSMKNVCKSGESSCMKHFDIGFGRRVPYTLTDKGGKIIFDVDKSQKELGITYLSLLNSLDNIFFSFAGLSPVSMGAYNVITQMKARLLNVLYNKGRFTKKDVEKIEQQIKELDDATGNAYSSRVNSLFTETSSMAKDHEMATSFFTDMAKGKYDNVLEKKCERYSLSFINTLIQYLKKYIGKSHEEGVKALFDRFVFEYDGNCKKSNKFKVLVYFNGNMKKPGFVFDLLGSCIENSRDKPMICAAKEFLNKQKEF
jgi:hypothetical protein